MNIGNIDNVSEEKVKRLVEEFVQEDKIKHMSVLLFLLHVDYATEADLRRAMTGGRYLAGRTAYVVLKELMDKGLIEMTRVKRYKIYRATELGRRVAAEIARRAGL